jgi:hypothetical protein
MHFKKSTFVICLAVLILLSTFQFTYGSTTVTSPPETTSPPV